MAPPPISETINQNIDQEPNNSPKQASIIEIKNPEFTFAGSLEPFNADYFLLKAKAGYIADIEIQPLDKYDIIVKFFNPENKSNWTINNLPAAQSEHIPNLKLSPQGIYLQIYAHNDQTFKYIVKIKQQPQNPDITLELEPNNEPATAQLLYTPAKISAFLNNGGDTDYYLINTQQKSQLKFEPFPSPVEIQLFNTTTWQTVSKANTPILSPPILPSDKNLSLIIRSLENINKPLNYTFELLPITDDATEQEPNDTPQLAQNIELSNSPLKLNFANPNDIDYFTFNTTNPDTILSLQLQTAPNINASMHIIETQTQQHFDFSSKTPQPRIFCAHQIKTPSQILIKTQLVPNQANINSPTDYQLFINTFNSPFELEPNETYENANELPLSQNINAFSYPANDLDIYKITIPSEFPTINPVGKLTVKTAPNYGKPLSLKLQDAQQGEIARTQSTNHNKPLTLSFDAPPGTYYLTVQGAGDNCQNPYQIITSFTPITPTSTNNNPQATASPIPNPTNTNPNTTSPNTNPNTNPNTASPNTNPTNTNPTNTNTPDLPPSAIDQLLDPSINPTVKTKIPDDDAF